MNVYQKIIALFSSTAIVASFFAVLPVHADTIGEHHNFFVDQGYDISQRTSVPATLVSVGTHSYIYVEDNVLQQYGGMQNSAFAARVNQVQSDFDNTIYPADVGFWGSEPNPGIDNDPHITLLFEQMNTNTGGYMDTANLFVPTPGQQSNQREMLFISTSSLLNGNYKEFMAHEFEHLISANQKIIIRNVLEDTWLDELRAQYSITVAGYNDQFNSSTDLYRRIRDFLDNPNDSMTEWQGSVDDYGSITLFGEYLVEHYGPGILQDTLKDRSTGITSINNWLTQHGYKERFGDIFSNWVVSDYINNTSGDSRFGYTNQNLSSLHVNVTDYRFLSYPATSSFSFSEKPWQAQWYRFIMPQSLPAGQNLKISWTASQINLMYADSAGNIFPVANGQVITPAAGISSFVVIPVNESKISGFTENDPSISSTLNISFTNQQAGPPNQQVITPTSQITDGTLIMPPDHSGVYVVTGKYKRYLVAGVPAMYGIDVSKAITVSSDVFNSYITSNYVRAINDKKVYAVWPDGTKHWLNITAQIFSSSGRDWNSIFIINNLELNFYKTGANITS